MRVDRLLRLDRREFSAIAIWPSNSAIASNASVPEDEGIHVHAWDHTGVQVLDETYGPVYLDGDARHWTLQWSEHLPFKGLLSTRPLSSPCDATRAGERF